LHHIRNGLFIINKKDSVDDFRIYPGTGVGERDFEILTRGLISKPYIFSVSEVVILTVIFKSPVSSMAWEALIHRFIMA
jgi:hypothetical protein